MYLSGNPKIYKLMKFKLKQQLNTNLPITWPKSRKLGGIQVQMAVWQGVVPLCPASGNTDWCSHSGEQLGGT